MDWRACISAYPCAVEKRKYMFSKTWPRCLVVRVPASLSNHQYYSHAWCSAHSRSRVLHKSPSKLTAGDTRYLPPAMSLDSYKGARTARKSPNLQAKDHLHIVILCLLIGALPGGADTGWLNIIKGRKNEAMFMKRGKESEPQRG
jgi:hypothetical protein